MESGHVSLQIGLNFNHTCAMEITNLFIVAAIVVSLPAQWRLHIV